MPTATTPRQERSGDARAGSGSSPAVRTLLVLLVLLTLVLAWQRRWTADDAFITFRAVRNVLDGNGPVFNAGERVEVGTSPLWLWLLAGADALVPVDVSWISVGLGALGSAAGVLCAALGALRLAGGTEDRPSSGQVFLPAGALVFLALPVTWDFLTSGLETGLTFGWLGALWYGAARQAADPTPRRPRWLLVVVGLGPLVRPDLTIVSAILGSWLLLALPSSWRRRAADALLAAAVPVGYEVFRMGWFGLLVPNTAVAKESGRAVWARGWTYLGDLVGPYDLVVPLVLCAALLLLTGVRPGWTPRAASLVGVTVLSAVLGALFVVRVGGDFMHGRLLLPSLFLLLCPVFVVPVVRWRRGRVPAVLGAALVCGVAAWSVVCASSLRVDHPAGFGPAGIADERGFYAAAAGVRHPVTLDDHGADDLLAVGQQVQASSVAGRDELFLSDVLVEVDGSARLVPVGRAAGGTTLRVLQAGFLGYAVDDRVRVVDTYGLTDPVGAHLEPSRPGRAGHEKETPLVWSWAREASGLPRPGVTAALDPVTSAGVADARAALDCGELAELVDATGGPMSWGRFWTNLTGAVDRTSLRVPLDPGEARDRFC